MTKYFGSSFLSMIVFASFAQASDFDFVPLNSHDAEKFSKSATAPRNGGAPTSTARINAANNKAMNEALKSAPAVKGNEVTGNAKRLKIGTVDDSSTSRTEAVGAPSKATPTRIKISR